MNFALILQLELLNFSPRVCNELILHLDNWISFVFLLKLPYDFSYFCMVYYIFLRFFITYLEDMRWRAEKSRRLFDFFFFLVGFNTLLPSRRNKVDLCFLNIMLRKNYIILNFNIGILTLRQFRFYIRKIYLYKFIKN